VNVLPGNHRVRLTWDSSQYVAEVVRLSKASAQAVVYRGATGRFTDRKLRNGRRYRYRVTLTDQAGNTSADRTKRRAHPLQAAAARRRRAAQSAPELVWKPVRRANYYNASFSTSAARS
jgi:hypothetical protein